MDEAYAILDADLASFTVWVGETINVSCKFCDYRFTLPPVAGLDTLVFPAREHDCEEYKQQLAETAEDRRLAARDRARAEANAQLEMDRGKSLGNPRRPSKTDGDSYGVFN